MRTLGVTELLSSVPEIVVLLFALLTQLGDPWFLFVMLAAIYWGAPHWPTFEARRSAAFLFSLGLGAAMLTLALKLAFGFPRPPGAAMAPEVAWLPSTLRGVVGWIATGDGFGFPSGHALGATVVYGGLAHLGDLAHRKQRMYVAGGLVAVVSLSRLVLGVHYLVDVVVGVAVGIAFLLGAIEFTNRDPTRGFGLAVALAVSALVLGLATANPEQVVTAAAGVGASVGALAGWRVVERRQAMDVRVSRTVAVPSLVVIATLWVVATEGPVPIEAVTMLDFLAAFLAVSLPALVNVATSGEKTRQSESPSDD
jgi:membrane-associated phospholipid phosphatase